MLVDPVLNEGIRKRSILCGLVPPEKIETGVYLSDLGFDIYFREHQDFKLDYPEFAKYPKPGWDFGCYGVCDNWKNLKAHLPLVVTESERKFVISLVPIYKEDQPERDGWRWHKWGEYIGEQTPTHEYLYDEPVIELVYAYHVYELGG